MDHFDSKFVFISLVRVIVHRIIPGIDVPDRPAVVRLIARGRKKNSTHVHQFAERKVDQQHTDQENVDKKER